MPNIDNFTIDDGSVKWKFKLLNENTNKIESISVDGVKQTIDSNKNVNITLNTKYATKDELDDYVKSSELSSITGGDINKIENVAVNGTDLIITDKRVNIDLNEYKEDIKTSIGNASSTSNGLMSKEDKDRLDGLITTGGEANKIDSISIDGTTITPDSSKNVDIPLFNSSIDGAVPKSDGSNTKFLRADGQWIEIKREPNETPDLLLSTNNIELNGNNLVETISITTNSDGEISVISNDENICTVNYNSTNKTITATYVNTGNTSITVSISATDTYKAVVKTITVSSTNNTYSPVLDENTIEEIVQAARDGLASSLWSVGDVYPIKLNGQLGPSSNTLENVEVELQIIGFNHNAEIEGNNTIHFQCGCIDGNPIALYWENGNPYLMHHATNTNDGGWEQSDIRTILCPQFYNCLPQEWQNVIQTTTKYTNNVGTSDNEDAVTATQDKVFILAEYEVFGAQKYANQYEQNKQQQYEYYINGTSYSGWNIRQRSLVRIPDLSDTSLQSNWWLRSPAYNYSGYFCYVSFLGDIFNNSNRRVATAVSVTSANRDFGVIANEDRIPGNPTVASGTEYYSSLMVIKPNEDIMNVTLTGNKNANTFYIYGGASNVLTGGLNADTFIFEGGGGVITDFGINSLRDTSKTYAKTSTQIGNDVYYTYNRFPTTGQSDYNLNGIFYAEGRDSLNVNGTVTKIEFTGADSVSSASKADRYFTAYVTYTDRNNVEQVIKLDNINKALNKKVYETNYVAAQSLNIKDNNSGDGVLTITQLRGLFQELKAGSYNDLDALTKGTNNVATSAALEASNYDTVAEAFYRYGFAPAFVIS